MKKLVAILSCSIGPALVGLWLYSFLGFVQNIEAYQEPNPVEAVSSAEAIVVLTGGSERIATGTELLEAGVGKKLFISGVHKNISIEKVIKTLPLSPELRACCIVLGYKANSTAENAQETRDWMKTESYASLRLVTANYHMPRSLLLFRAAMPDVTIIPHPVTPDNVKLHEFWEHPGTISLLLTEYTKYLLVQFNLWLNAP